MLQASDVQQATTCRQLKRFFKHFEACLKFLIFVYSYISGFSRQRRFFFLKVNANNNSQHSLTKTINNSQLSNFISLLKLQFKSLTFLQHGSITFSGHLTFNPIMLIAQIQKFRGKRKKNHQYMTAKGCRHHP